MSASNEWTIWHLTPRGWDRGTEKEDFQRTDRDPPADRVLSVKWIEYMGHTFGALQSYHEEVWRHPDTEFIAKLINDYGEAPKYI